MLRKPVIDGFHSGEAAAFDHALLWYFGVTFSCLRITGHILTNFIAKIAEFSAGHSEVTLKLYQSEHNLL